MVSVPCWKVELVGAIVVMLLIIAVLVLSAPHHRTIKCTV